MAEAREEYGGYSGFAFVDKPSDALNCPICLCPMRDTVQTACGHRFCRSCLWQTFRQNNTRLCPQCRTSIRGNNQLFFDSAWQRDIDSLRVKCKSRKRGCAWIGAVGHYKEHKNVCNYRVVTCNDCGSKMLERHFNTHQTTECPFRTVLCEHCEEDFIAHFLEEHTATCPFRIVHCEHCGEDFIAHFIEPAFSGTQNPSSFHSFFLFARPTDPPSQETGRWENKTFYWDGIYNREKVRISYAPV
ncbi:TNF receptor-associated factor 4-like isoform X2 [Oculina patagonica]